MPEIMDEAIFILLILPCSAFAVWLTVRIINRRERWAKRIAAVMVAMIVVGYPLSFGPACWIMSRTADQMLPTMYMPIGYLISYSPPWASDALSAYATAGMPPGAHIYVPTDNDSVEDVSETP